MPTQQPAYFVMEHEIGAICPPPSPAEGPAWWDLGPGHCWGPCEQQRLWCLDFHPGWWAAQGRPALLLWFLCPAAVLPFVLPGSPSCPPPNIHSTLNKSFMSCRTPGRSWPWAHPWGHFPFIFWEVTALAMSHRTLPLAVIPGTLLQLLFLLTAVWGLCQIQENVCEALQKPEMLQPADLGPGAPSSNTLYFLIKPRTISTSGLEPGFQGHFLRSTESLLQRVVCLAWISVCPFFVWVHTP